MTTARSSGPKLPISAVTAAAAAVDLGALPVASDDRGVPRLLRATDAMPAIPGDATSSARGHVARLAPAWGVRTGAMPALEGRGEIALPGGTIVRLRQLIDGMPVDASAGGEVRVMVRKDGSMIAASGTLISNDTPRAKAVAYVDDDAGAVARAVRALYKGTTFAPTALAARSVASDGARMLGGQNGQVNVSMARARKAWWPEAKGLTAAWIVEAYSSDLKATGGDAYRTVISADGRVLAQTNLTADVAFTYRVFAETTGEFHPFDGPIVDSTPSAPGVPPSTVPFPNTPYPAYVLTNLVTVDGLNHPAGQATPDPWLASGRTETLGNNVEAYTDVNAPDGLTFGDFRATLTAARTFDRAYDPTLGPLSSQGQQMAGITSLFYIINWMHDFWYDGGFTEAAGNAQNANFGRGGEDRDALLAEAQDNANGGSRNNANMSTPGDGLPPKMQVFVWDNKDLERSIAVSGRLPQSGTASFARFVFDVTAELVLADDNTDTKSDACTALPAAVAGKIVLADRGTCSFKTKAVNAQAAGAGALIIANNAAGDAPPTLGDDPAITTKITMPVLSVTLAEGTAMKQDLAAGTVIATMHRIPDLNTDVEGTLDATVVAHEFGHYLHHRLSNCNTTLCGAMSEGWGDFSALLVAARSGDDLTGAFPMGIYSKKGDAGDPLYFGIRRAPYSVTTTLNGFTFKHIGQGTALPTTFPINGGNPATNNEVHAAGEVWANIMWEGYVALQANRGTKTFDDVRLTMRKYIVGGLLLSPTDNTPTEMRDAILAVAHAASPADHDVLAAAYARRGLGSCAVSPARGSTTFAGITEGFEVKGRIVAGVVSIAPTDSCDADSVLDAGETGRITVAVANGGPAEITNVAVTLSSTTPGIHIATPTATVGALGAYSNNTTVTFDITLDDTVTSVVAGDLKVSVAAAASCKALEEIAIAIPLNSDDKPASSATDTFDAIGSAWVPTTTPTLWSHVRPTALDGELHGVDDSGSATDASIVSPALTAGAAPVTLKLTHRFAFEGTVAQAFDGGVVEYTTDNGASWKDIATIAAASPYNVTLLAGSNPLGVRRAFGATSAGYPATVDVTIDLGTQLAGTTFKLRFRVGSDENTGAAGWDIDNVAFTGLTNTPFPTLVTDTGSCDAGPDGPPIDAGAVDAARPDAYVPPDAGGNPDTGDGGGCCQTGTGLGAGNVGGVLLVLGLLLRRRRR